MKQPLPNEDLFEKFTIDNYAACVDWEVNEWLLALSQRAALRHYLRKINGKINQLQLPKEILYGERDFFLKAAQERITNPLKINSGADSIPVVPCGLRDFILRDIMFATELIKKSGLQDGYGIRLRDVAQMVGASSMTFLGVDLNYPDSILQEKFNNWLSKVRTEISVAPVAHIYPSTKSFGKIDFEKWHASKLLPYLDLVFWARLSEFDLRQDVIGKKLFPLLEDTKDRLKSIPRNALKLISRDSIHVLARQSQTY